jgi:hypothetical protein
MQDPLKDAPDQRPPFMVTLGLLPPYSREDVQEAYHEKAKTTHPDRGGSSAEFEKLHAAYEQALEYMTFHLDRRKWLASQVERYATQEKIANQVRDLGGAIELEHIDWMKRSFGEYAALVDRLRGIRVRGRVDGDAFIKHLVEHAAGLDFLVWLDLAGCRISDQGFAQLGVLKSLRRLDLSSTPISEKALTVLEALPSLEWLNLASTSIGWWARRRLRRSFPRVQVANTPVAETGQPSA